MNQNAQKRIGALTIGQSPRPDLVSPLVHVMPDCEIIQAGALDGLTLQELSDVSGAAYPLVTQMQNGALVMVDEDFIAPKLQIAQDRLDAEGVTATLLLCAGTFADLHGNKPVYKPFQIGCSVLSALNLRSIGLIAPVLEQEAPIRQRWKKMGWEPTVWTADLERQDEAFHRQLTDQINDYELDGIVLDYVGHPLDQVSQLQGSIEIPVIDLCHLAMITLASTCNLPQR